MTNTPCYDSQHTYMGERALNILGRNDVVTLHLDAQNLEPFVNHRIFKFSICVMLVEEPGKKKQEDDTKKAADLHRLPLHLQ